MSKNPRTIAQAIREARAKEREKLAKWMISMTLATGHGDTIEDLLKELGEQIDELRAWAGGLVEPMINGETSDGYHTFNELYEHRVLLWINLCLLQKEKCYLVEEHYAGWFLLGMETDNGQISYHCPNKYLALVSTIKREHPEFDGHDSKIVIERLLHTAMMRGKV